MSARARWNRLSLGEKTVLVIGVAFFATVAVSMTLFAIEVLPEVWEYDRKCDRDPANCEWFD